MANSLHPFRHSICAVSLLSFLGAPVFAQVTTAPSLPPVAPSAPAQTTTPQRSGGGVGVGVTIDLGSLFGGRRAAPSVILAAGNSMAKAANGTAAASNPFLEMQPNSLVDHGMITSALTGPCPDAAMLAAFAQQINQQIMASGRFGAFTIPGAAGMTPQQLAQAVQIALTQQQGVDMAKQRSEAAGQDSDFKYRDTIVTGDAMAQVKNSVYGYEVVIGAPVTQKLETPQGTRYVTSIPVTINFYKIVTAAPNGAPLPGGPQIQSVPGGQINFGLTGVSPSPDPCPGIQNAFSSAAIQTSGVTQGVQGIPVFQARGKVVDVPSGTGGVGSIITMRPGANEGVKQGDEYDIYEMRDDGTKMVVGHAVVTKVGTGLVAGGEGASKADAADNRTQLRVTQIDQGYGAQRGGLQGIQVEQHLQY